MSCIVPAPLVDRFYSKIEFIPFHACWEWMAGKHRTGYGVFNFERTRQIGAHRASWMIHRGEIPDGMFVCHRCDNPGCVNPDHLFLGTHEENMQDMVKKGRGRSPQREKNHCKKGHPFDLRNTMVIIKGRTEGRNERKCRACMAVWAQKTREKNREKNREYQRKYYANKKQG